MPGRFSDTSRFRPAPGHLGAVLVAFTVSLDDFRHLLRQGPGATTLPLKVYSMIKSGVTPEINALVGVVVAGLDGMRGSLLHLQRRGCEW